MAIELTSATTAQISGINQTLGVGPSLTNIAPNGYLYLGEAGLSISFGRWGDTINFKNCYNLRQIIFSPAVGWKIKYVLNAQDLISIEDFGTTNALRIINHEMQATDINKMFTDLPVTSKTATINVQGNPGAATCDTSIATSKGYTVVT